MRYRFLGPCFAVLIVSECKDFFIFRQASYKNAERDEVVKYIQKNS